MLTRDNIYAEIDALTSVRELNAGDTTISILPYSHIYEQTISLLFPMQFGITIFFLQLLTPRTLKDAFKDLKPRYLVLVPELLKTLSDKINYFFIKTNLSKPFLI